MQLKIRYWPRVVIVIANLLLLLFGKGKLLYSDQHPFTNGLPAEKQLS